MNELESYKQLEEIKRMWKSKQVVNRKIYITEAGMQFQHNMGVVPTMISVVPLSEFTWWCTRPPDAQRVYLQSSADGDALITVKGD